MVWLANTCTVVSLLHVYIKEHINHNANLTTTMTVMGKCFATSLWLHVISYEHTKTMLSHYNVMLINFLINNFNLL